MTLSCPHRTIATRTHANRRHSPDPSAAPLAQYLEETICLDFWLPCVILPLGYIYVTVDVPLMRSLRPSFPQLTLTLFS